MNALETSRDRRRGGPGLEGRCRPRGPQSFFYAGALPGSLLLCLFLATGCGDATGDTPDTEPAAASVRPGIQVLLRDSLHLVRDRRVGLITNHTGLVPSRQRPGDPAAARSSIDVLAEAPQVELVALFGPEHGIRGDAEAGERVESGMDPRTGVPIHSLYGATRRPSPESLDGVEVLVFDMQDVGARFYTYVSTMAYAMEAAGAAGMPFVVVDRPNPIRGDVVQGNVLDPSFATFVGLYPVPMRHGMTVGELARMIVGEFGVEVELHVVPMDGWDPTSVWAATELPWVAPSPNLPSVASALAYPGTCLFEGTPLSVGRGTERAFQWVGAPWLDGAALADAMNAYGIDGVRFEAARFTPENPGDGKFGGMEVQGVRFVSESTDYDAPRAAVALLVETRRASGDRWSWNQAHFDRLAGTDSLRLGLEAGLGLEELTAGWPAQQAAFEVRRAPYLLYRD